MKGYNFTERARQVLSMARDESVSLGHEYVGTEHILLGILREGEGMAVTVLHDLSVETDELRDMLLSAIKRGSATVAPDQLPYTSRSKKVLELAMSTAREENHAYLGTEHLLMGLIRERKGIAAQVLAYLGVNEANALDRIRELLMDVPGQNRIGALEYTQQPASRAPRFFAQYPERLRCVISAAQDVAVRQRSKTVTSTHAMIALLEHRDGLANAALDSLSLDRQSAIAALQSLAPVGDDRIGPNDVITPSPDYGRLLHALGTPTTGSFSVGTHHLLLLTLQMSPEIAAVFENHGLPYDRIRNRIGQLTG